MAKILFISKYIRTVDEGTPTRHYFFCRNFAKNGHEVKVIKSRSSFGTHIPSFKSFFREQNEGLMNLVTINGPLISRGFSFKRLITWITFELGVLRYLRQLRAYKPDVVVVSSLSIFTFLTGVWLKRKYKVPLIVEVRDIYPLTLTEVAGFNKYNPLIIIMALIEKFGYRNADYIVSSLDHLDSHVKEIIDREFNFEWIPTGFEDGLYKELPPEEYPKGFDRILESKVNGDFIIGYAGTIGLANALDVIFEAAIVLNDSHPKIKFVFIGSGPLKNFYAEKFEGYANIIFLDFVKKQYLPDLLGNFHILINTWKRSRMYAYGISPNKWNEYMYAGRPFILTHDYDSKIFKEAQCGWQIQTNDVTALVKKIVEISVLQKDVIDGVGENGRRYLLEKLSYTYLAKIYERVMITCINKYSKKSI